jgi:serine/threonine protein kinase
MFSGLAHIHGKGLLHRDLKPENILVDSDVNVKICDLGTAREEVDYETVLSDVGTAEYCAPEVFSKQYSKAVDVWSAGCVIAECMLGQPLFKLDSKIKFLPVHIVRKYVQLLGFPPDGTAAGEQMSKVKHLYQNSDPPPPLEQNFRPEHKTLVKLLASLLTWDAADRKSAREAMSSLRLEIFDAETPSSEDEDEEDVAKHETSSGDIIDFPAAYLFALLNDVASFSQDFPLQNQECLAKLAAATAAYAAAVAARACTASLPEEVRKKASPSPKKKLSLHLSTQRSFEFEEGEGCAVLEFRTDETGALVNGCWAITNPGTKPCFFKGMLLTLHNNSLLEPQHLSRNRALFRVKQIFDGVPDLQIFEHGKNYEPSSTLSQYLVEEFCYLVNVNTPALTSENPLLKREDEVFEFTSQTLQKISSDSSDSETPAFRRVSSWSSTSTSTSTSTGKKERIIGEHVSELDMYDLPVTRFRYGQIVAVKRQSKNLVVYGRIESNAQVCEVQEWREEEVARWFKEEGLPELIDSTDRELTVFKGITGKLLLRSVYSPQQCILETYPTDLSRNRISQLVPECFAFEKNQCGGGEGDEGGGGGVRVLPRASLPKGLSYHGFISYRVWCDSDVAEKLFLSLEREGLKIFWDKQCLKDGQKWEDGFMQGLQKSKRVVALISEKTLKGIADKACTQPDNVLKEWEAAVDKFELDSKYIVPVLIGEYVKVADSNGEALKRFGSFGGIPGKPWPDSCSTTCKDRTIKQLMAKLFSIQGIHLDPKDIATASKRIHDALLVGE